MKRQVMAIIILSCMLLNVPMNVLAEGENDSIKYRNQDQIINDNPATIVGDNVETKEQIAEDGQDNQRTVEDSDGQTPEIQSEENVSEGEQSAETVDVQAVQIGWKYTDGYWYYHDNLGNPEVQKWINDNGAWYYMDVDGKMLANTWVTEGASRYFLTKSGAMKCSSWLYNNGQWYYLASDGRLVTDMWLNDGGIWYFVNADGVMVANQWLYLGNQWYFFKENGAMKTGWLWDNGTWYYMASGGQMVASTWLNDKGTWYYVNANGGMLANCWSNIGNQWYYFTDSGAMKKGWLWNNGAWYYLTGSGAMATGWIQLGENYYYLYSNGSMASDTRIDGHIVAPDGAYNEAYQAAGEVLDSIGWEMTKAFTYSTYTIKHQNGGWNASDGSRMLALQGFQNLRGNCYVMAATFYYMAKLMGYDAHQVSGEIMTSGGGTAVHSWVEIDQEGSTYVCDPSFTQGASGRWGFMFSYGTSGTWKYVNYYRMN